MALMIMTIDNDDNVEDADENYKDNDDDQRLLLIPL